MLRLKNSKQIHKNIFKTQEQKSKLFAYKNGRNKFGNAQITKIRKMDKKSSAEIEETRLQGRIPLAIS